MNSSSNASIYDILRSTLKQLIWKDMQIYTPSAYLEAKMMAERLWKAAPGMIYVEKLCQSRFPWSKGGGVRGVGRGISTSQTRTFINKYQKLRRKCSHASEQSHRVAGEASTDGEHCSAVHVASSPNKWGIVRPPFFMSSEPIINSFCLFLRKIFYL